MTTVLWFLLLFLAVGAAVITFIVAFLLYLAHSE